MKKLVLIGCMVLLFVVCASKKQTVKTEELEEVIVFGEETTAVSEEPVVPEPAAPPVTEEEIKPPAPVEETTPPEMEEAAAPAEEEVAALPPAPPVPAAPSEKVLGFRVQIFASSTDKNAQKVADDARTAFGQTAYVEHIAPYYKVRVGDCLTREDAEALKTKALSLGYRGAFIVETMISP